MHALTALSWVTAAFAAWVTTSAWRRWRRRRRFSGTLGD
jgi:hypothetical protein